MYNSIDCIQTCIQELFAEANNAVEVAKIYHEVLTEAERQLEHMMEQFGNNN